MDISKLLQQLTLALSTAYGWIIALIAASVTFFQPERWSFIAVGLAILADLIWGILAAVSLKKFILSKALRETIKKIGIYISVMLLVYIAEMALHLDGAFVGVKVTAVLVVVCELWSTSASMLIVKPDMPFLKLFRLQLKGEIESKLNKSVEFDKIFKDDEVSN